MSESIAVNPLSQDPPLPGQEWVCLSFVSPESDVEKRELYMMNKFLESLPTRVPDFKLPEGFQLKEAYEQFKYENELSITTEYEKLYPGRSSLRALKIRGSFATEDAARKYADTLKDPYFHIFVGKVGCWLPWDPAPHNIEEEVFADEKLHELVTKYKQNIDNRNKLFHEETRNRLEEIRYKNTHQPDLPVEEPGTSTEASA
jgi:hypothetical protein